MTYAYKILEDGTMVPYPIDTQLPIICPNCVTPWKCNGPHLEKKTSGLYSSIDGYYILMHDINEWVFIPYEKNFSSHQLLDISNTLNILNNQVS